jgi:hypothetical protein
LSEIYRKALRRERRTAIRDFPDGSEGKIAGRLSCLGTPLTAPLSGRACAYWALWVEYLPEDRGEMLAVWRNSLDDKVSLKVLFSASDGQDFVIDDETGTACVRIAGAAVALTRDRHVDPATLPDPSAALIELVERQGVAWSQVHQQCWLREGVLEPGELVTVFGRGRREPDPRTPGGYREAPLPWLVVEAPPGGTLIVSDIKRVAK